MGHSHSQFYRSNCVSETAKPLSLKYSTLKKRLKSKMSVIEFSCSLETVPGPKSVISLFRDHDKQQNEETNDEYLMTIQAEVPIQDEKDAKTPEAEFIVVVDRSGSMGGTPWAQVQQALVQMILLALVKTTSSVVGKCSNIEITSENMDFLGNNFMETTNDIVLPATVTRAEGKMKMITKKFMRLKKDQEPKMQLKVHENLTGKSEGQKGVVQNCKIDILEKEEDIADHNLKKLRTAMNMVMAKISDANDEKEKEKMKVWFELLNK